MGKGKAKSEPHRITEIYAFVGFDPSQNAEGIPALRTDEGVTLPLIASDPERRDFFRETAQSFADQTGQTLKLMKFSNAEVLEEIKPTVKGS